MKIEKSCPDPTVPSEVVNHYFQQFVKWIRVNYRDKLLDPFGNKRKQRFRELMKLKNSGTGKECFILSGGPSINKLNPFKIKEYCELTGAETFCLNYFVNSAFAQDIDIDYWVLSDPRHFDLDIKLTKLAFKNANSIIKKGILASSLNIKKIKGQTNLPLIEFNDVQDSNILSNSINPCYPRSYLNMTAYKTLAISIFFNYKRIYICGFDNTFARNLGCDRENNLYRISKHFYSKPNNLESRDYRLGQSVGEKVRKRNVSDTYLAYSRLFSDLKKFKNHPIINLDIDSLTDMFVKDNSLDIYN